MNHRIARMAAGVCIAAYCAAGFAVLPPLSEAQKQAAADKKVVADADAARSKEVILATMDALTARWRANAASKGLPVLPPVPIAAPVAALTAPTTQAITPPQVTNPAKP